MDCKS